MVIELTPRATTTDPSRIVWANAASSYACLCYPRWHELRCMVRLLADNEMYL